MRYNNENLVNGSSTYMSISHPSRYKIYKTPTTYYYTGFCRSDNDKNIYKTKYKVFITTSEAR